MASVESVLSTATKIKPKSREKRQDYLKRLALAVDDLTKEEWNDLPDEAQEWSNEAVKQAGNGGEIIDPSKPNGADKDDKPSGKKPSTKKASSKASAKAAPRGTQKATSGKKVTAKGSGKATAKAASKAAPKAKSGDVSGGSMTFLKETLIKDPGIAKDALMEKMRNKGFKTSEKCVATWKAYWRHTVKVFQLNGYLKDFEL